MHHTTVSFFFYLFSNWLYFPFCFILMTFLPVSLVYIPPFVSLSWLCADGAQVCVASHTVYGHKSCCFDTNTLPSHIPAPQPEEGRKNSRALRLWLNTGDVRMLNLERAPGSKRCAPPNVEATQIGLLDKLKMNFFFLNYEWRLLWECSDSWVDWWNSLKKLYLSRQLKIIKTVAKS